MLVSCWSQVATRAIFKHAFRPKFKIETILGRYSERHVTYGKTSTYVALNPSSLCISSKIKNSRTTRRWQASEEPDDVKQYIIAYDYDFVGEETLRSSLKSSHKVGVSKSISSEVVEKCICSSLQLQRFGWFLAALNVYQRNQLRSFCEKGRVICVLNIDR